MASSVVIATVCLLIRWSFWWFKIALMVILGGLSAASICSTNLVQESGNFVHFITNSSEEEAVRKAAVLMLNLEEYSAFENQLVFETL